MKVDKSNHQSVPPPMQPPTTHLAQGTPQHNGDEQTMTIRREWLKCSLSPVYFAVHYLWIYNATDKAWLRFHLWQAQEETILRMHHEAKLVVLKARQLGLSWLALAYALWMMLFQAPATVLLFSLKESEAIELLERLTGMYTRLPDWMQARATVKSNEKRWQLTTGSRALAFSTQQGRSYTGSLAIIDEADFIPDLSSLLNGVKPTIDAGGKLFLISTSDKKRPVSTFKNLFRAAHIRSATTGSARGALWAPAGTHNHQENAGDYRSLFLPWSARPDRDAAWHRRTKAEMFAQRGTDDDFYAEYPASVEEALAPEQLDRRIPLDWLKPCIDDSGRVTVDGGPAVPGLVVYVAPIDGHHYVIGADPAEGNPNSDDSAATIMDAGLLGSPGQMDAETWQEVACVVGKFEPSAFAGYLTQVAVYYNSADILPERNNHGHALILALHEMGSVRVLNGYDGKPGWLSNIRGKPLLYDLCARAVHEQACIVRSNETASQLASIEASTLRAPQGLHDDRADSFALCIAALTYHRRSSSSVVRHAGDPLAEIDRSEGF